MPENTRFERFSFEPNDPEIDTCLRIMADPKTAGYFPFRLSGYYAREEDDVVIPKAILACFGDSYADSLRYQIYGGHQIEWLMRRLSNARATDIMYSATKRVLRQYADAGTPENWYSHEKRDTYSPLALAAVTNVQTARGARFPLDLYHPKDITPLFALEMMQRYAEEGLQRLAR